MNYNCLLGFSVLEEEKRVVLALSIPLVEQQKSTGYE